jgi:PhoH-like ATPase
MKKTYVVDTNVLLSDPNSLNAFGDNNLIIPMIVLEELDNHKNRLDEVGRNARQVSRALDEMRQAGNGTLFEGVELSNGGRLTIAQINKDFISEIPKELQVDKVDNLLIAFMVVRNQKFPDEHAVLVSKDINVRLKCDAIGIRCEDYLRLRVTSDAQKFFRGVETIEVSEDRVSALYNGEAVVLTDDELKDKVIYPNQIVVVKNIVGTTTRSAITRCVKRDKPLVLVPKIENVYGLKPRNKEQNFSLDLLLNPDIKLMTLVGPAGTGKTLLALAAALQQLKTLGASGIYDKIIVTRPVLPVGRDIGFLPGSLEEKMEPWIAPVRDNLNFLMGSQKSNRRKKASSSIGGEEPYLSLLQDRGLIEIEAITFIRGRSIPNSFIVIDEAQNLSMHELKTIITRVGDGTKIVLTGDLDQIDNVHVDAYTNGLTYAVEKFKEYDVSAHVTLVKGERSALATLASQIL